MKLSHYFLISSLLLLCSCFPSDVKEKMKQEMEKSMEDMVLSQFHNAIEKVEVHKLRTGEYPETLVSMSFLTMTDSAMFNWVKYQRLETGYELNLTGGFPALTEEEAPPVKLPKKSWQGLGCVKSNLMPQ